VKQKNYILTIIFAITMSFFHAKTAFSSNNHGYFYETLVQSHDQISKTHGKSLNTTPELINAWGIAIRPAGMGGHFWVTAKDKSFQYQGDVRQSNDPQWHQLSQDSLPTIVLPVGGDEQFATGTTFMRGNGFVITQRTPDHQIIRAPAKFLFASDGGIISAWTERKNADGSFAWPDHAVSVIDENKNGAQFFGITISSSGDKIYAADFGAAPGIKSYDKNFQPLAISFEQPFDENKNGKIDAGEYAPFNIQLINLNGKESLFVAYAKTQSCPADAVNNGDCARGEIFPGEEDAASGHGRIAQFDMDGKLIAVWHDKGMLNAPWGFAAAPENFGKHSGKLLVSNFGDGTITVFDPVTRQANAFLKTDGKKFSLEGIWGLQFGNGASLGDSNALYVAAGPGDETQGAFGVIRRYE
jgi:uncharacterized protein (TIGR03118 family)